jgi:hypothetical protein
MRDRGIDGMVVSMYRTQVKRRAAERSNFDISQHTLDPTTGKTQHDDQH